MGQLSLDYMTPGQDLRAATRSKGALFWLPTVVWGVGMLIAFGAYQLGASGQAIGTICLVGVAVLAANLAGQFPLMFISSERPDGVTAALLLSIATRASLTLVGMLIILSQGEVLRTAVLAFVGWYGLLLITELWSAARYFRVVFPSPGGPESAAEAPLAKVNQSAKRENA